MSERNDPELMKVIVWDLGQEELVTDISKMIEKPAAAPGLGNWIRRGREDVPRQLTTN